jgi:hypothetical protein
MHGLFSIPLNLFLAMVSPPDPASLQTLEKGLDRIARDFDLSDREIRTLKDGLVEPFRQEGMPLGPDTVQWMQLLNRRLLALPPGVVSAGAELQWCTLDLKRYARGISMQQYIHGLTAAPPEVQHKANEACGGDKASNAPRPSPSSAEDTVRQPAPEKGVIRKQRRKKKR